MPDRVRPEAIRLLEVELSEPPFDVAAHTGDGKHYRRARALVRLHERPLGLVELPLGRDGVEAEEVERRIKEALGPAIANHLARDGQVAHIAAAGSEPPCRAERARFRTAAPFATIAVATHDRTESLEDCLESLLELDYPHYEIVVVDNAPSTPLTRDLVATRFAGDPRVRYLRENRRGVAAAHNRALGAARGSIVAFTDDDVVVDRMWLLELAAGFTAAPDVACVTGLILPRELETPVQLWLDEHWGFSKGFERRLFDLHAHRPRNRLFPYAAGLFGSGANMAFRTDVLRRVGGFDAATGAGSLARGGDDLAAFFGVVAAGHTLVYEPAAIVHHRHRPDYASLCAHSFGYGVVLTAYLTKKVVDEPRRSLDLARRAPAGAAHAFAPRSPAITRRPPGLPQVLATLECAGSAYGPIAYLRARRMLRRSARPASGRGRST
ncbi:MAG: hypothetical protein QOD52_1991 [Gaiellaceae bacterium]|nr:hypothetical protein [Gaiellaceae bacterium]